MATLADKVLTFANSQVDKRVYYSKSSAGECWDLAEKALEVAGAQTSRQIMGRISGKQDYVWGDVVTFNNLQPGYIIQFRNFRNVIKITKTFRDESYEIQTLTSSRPHHTAIVKSIGANKMAELLEQNIMGNKKVAINQVYFSSSSWTEDKGNYKLQYKVTVSGKVWFYKPRS